MSIARTGEAAYTRRGAASREVRTRTRPGGCRLATATSSDGGGACRANRPLKSSSQQVLLGLAHGRLDRAPRANLLPRPVGRRRRATPTGGSTRTTPHWRRRSRPSPPARTATAWDRGWTCSGGAALHFNGVQTQRCTPLRRCLDRGGRRAPARAHHVPVAAPRADPGSDHEPCRA